MPIVDKKIADAEYIGNDISGLSNTPSADGLSAATLRARFDAIVKLVLIPKYNSFIDMLVNVTVGVSGARQIGYESTTRVPHVTVYAAVEKAFDVTDALNIAKVDKVTGKSLLSDTEITRLLGLSNSTYVHPTTHSADIIVDGTTNKTFLATERTKLAGIADGSEVNINADWNSIAGDSLILNKPTIPVVTGSNTGDETLTTIKTKLGITTLSGSNTGDQTVPTTLAALTDDITHRVVTDTEKATWNGKQVAGTYSTDIHSNIIALNAVTGANTGDETLATIKTKLGVTTLSGSNTGDQVLPMTLPASSATSLVITTGLGFTPYNATNPSGYTNYTHPANHPPTIISQDLNNRFVTDTEKSTWNSKEPLLTIGSLPAKTTWVDADLIILDSVGVKNQMTVATLKTLMSTGGSTTLASLGVTASPAELNFTTGVTSAIQTQLNDKVNNAQVLTNVPVGALFTDTVYTHPLNHLPAIITQDLNNRFVTDAEKSTWNGKANIASPTFTGNVGVGMSALNKVDIYDANISGVATALRVQGATTPGWSGRIIAGGQTVAFLMGEYVGKAWLGAHNAALNAWSDFYINPDGLMKLHIGSIAGATNGVAMTVDNANGNVGIKKTIPTESLDVVGNIKATGTILGSNLSGSNTGDQTIASLGAATFKTGTGTFALGGTTCVITDAFITTNTLVIVSPTQAKVGSWSVVSSAGSFTITSDATETSNVTFDWGGTK